MSVRQGQQGNGGYMDEAEQEELEMRVRKKQGQG